MVADSRDNDSAKETDGGGGDDSDESYHLRSDS